MRKVHIATSRPSEIGNRCKDWAATNTPIEYDITEEPDECDVFISVLYDTILNPEFLNDFRNGSKRRSYNFHPGILPNYRGAGVYSWVLINKETETGVTLHEIDPDIDSGPIIDIARTTIIYQDTAESLFLRCMDLLFQMFVTHYHRILSGEYVTTENEGGNFYSRQSLEGAKDITHMIKAFRFYGKESAYWFDSRGNRRHIEWE